MRPMVQSRSEETRSKVIEAARALLMRKGVADVSLADIREESGVSNGSIFHHFGSKDGVVAQVFVAERRTYLAEVARAVVEFDGDPCDALGEGARMALVYQMRDPQRFSRLVLDFTDSEWMRENRQIWLDLAADLTAPVAEWAAPHFAEGRLPRLPPAFIQSMMMGGTERLVSSYLMGRLEEDPMKLADAVAVFISGGLRSMIR